MSEQCPVCKLPIAASNLQPNRCNCPRGVEPDIKPGGIFIPDTVDSCNKCSTDFPSNTSHVCPPGTEPDIEPRPLTTGTADMVKLWSVCPKCDHKIPTGTHHVCPEPGGYMVESATMPWMCPHCHNHIPAEYDRHHCGEHGVVCKPGTELEYDSFIDSDQLSRDLSQPGHRDSSKHVPRQDIIPEPTQSGSERTAISGDSLAIQQIIDAAQCMLLIKYLTEDEGESVTIINDNPDPCLDNRQSSIMWSGGFDHSERQFWGKDTLDCLRQAEDMKRST